MSVPVPPALNDVLVYSQPPPAAVLDAITQLRTACEAWPMVKSSAPANALPMPVDDAAAHFNMMCSNPETVGHTYGWGGVVFGIVFCMAVYLCRKMVRVHYQSSIENAVYYVGAFIMAFLAAIVLNGMFLVFANGLPTGDYTRLVNVSVALAAVGCRWWTCRTTMRPDSFKTV